MLSLIIVAVILIAIMLVFVFILFKNIIKRMDDNAKKYFVNKMPSRNGNSGRAHKKRGTKKGVNHLYYNRWPPERQGQNGKKSSRRSWNHPEEDHHKGR